MRRPWRITPCPAIHGWAFLCFMCIILQYLTSFASRLHEGVPPAAFPVARFSYAVTGFSFVYALALQQSRIIILFIFLQALCNFFHKKEIVQGFLMYNEFDHDIEYLINFTDERSNDFISHSLSKMALLQVIRGVEVL